MNTYIVPSGWDIGCDDCGWYDTVYSAYTAKRLVEYHVCEVS